MNSRKRYGVGQNAWLLAGLALCLQVIPAGCATPSGQSPQDQVAQGKAELAKGQVNQAIVLFSKAAKTLGIAPGSCECHLCLGKALCQKAKAEKTSNAQASMTDLLASKKELRTAIRVGKGNAISKQA